MRRIGTVAWPQTCATAAACKVCGLCAAGWLILQLCCFIAQPCAACTSLLQKSPRLPSLACGALLIVIERGLQTCVSGALQLSWAGPRH